MPQARKWRDNAEKQKAYRERKRLAGQDAKMKPEPVAPGATGKDPSGFIARIQKAGDDAIDQFFKPDPKPSRR